MDNVAQLKHESGRGVVMLARLGYAAKGIVYSVVGVLAVMFVLGEGGGLTDNKGAIQKISAQPFGIALVWLVAAGLLCYAIWNAVRATLDPANVGTDKKGLVKRFGYGLSAVWHVLLAVYAGQLAYGSDASEGSTESSVAKLMSMPLGQVLVGIVGLVTVGFGLFQIYRAIANKVGDEFDEGQMSEGMKTFACRVARIGIGARGLVFPMIGGSLVLAAFHRQPGQAEGFSDSMRELASQPFGEFLIAFVAAGLLAYGLYLLCVARYATIPQPR